MTDIQSLIFNSKFSTEIDPEDILVFRESDGVQHVEVSYTDGKRQTSVLMYVTGSHDVLLPKKGLNMTTTQPFIARVAGQNLPAETPEGKAAFALLVQQFRADFLACSKGPLSPNYEAALQIVAMIAERDVQKKERLAREQAERDLAAAEKKLKSVAISAEKRAAALAAAALAAAAPAAAAM